MSDNAYGINRGEYWTVEKDQAFDSKEEAEQYVIEKSRIYTDLIGMTDYPFEKDPKKRDQLIRTFCLGENDEYLIHRRFFIGYPNIEKIKNRLADEGIRVLFSPKSK